jgi:hypothetical protein
MDVITEHPEKGGERGRKRKAAPIAVRPNVSFVRGFPHGRPVVKPPIKNPNPRMDSKWGQEYMISF